MVRNYVRKSHRGAGYSQETLKIAVDLVKTGLLTSYRASKIYKIPKNTLADHVKGRRGKLSSSYGRRTEFTPEEETSLADCIRCLEKWGFGLTRKEIIQIVADYVRQNNITTRFKNGIPGEDWFLNFKRRHNLSLKIPQSVEFARKKNVDPFLMYDYFDLLEKTVKELGLEEKPSQIWNLDESSFCSDPSKTKIVGQRGLPSTRTTSGPGKQNTTVLMCCNAVGVKAPPLIIFKGKNVWDQWVAPPATEFPNTTYAATSNGWMESTVFKNYFEKSFIKQLPENRPVLVIYDGHATHLSVDVIKTAIENQITILKLPPHTSHLLQPLDLSVFKSLKTRWDAKLVEWQRKNVGVKIPKCIFSKLIGEIWTDTKPEIIINGFVKAGICPINRNVVPIELFDPTALQRWKSSQAQKMADESLPSTSAQDNHQMPTSTTRMHNDYQITPDLLLDETSVILNQDQESSMGALAMVNVQSQDDNNSHKTGATFEELLLKFIKRDQVPTKQPRKRVCLGAEVITQKDVTHFQQKTQEKKVSKKKKIVQRKKNIAQEKKTRKISSDESDLVSWISDTSSDKISEFDDLSDAEMDKERDFIAEFSQNSSNSNPQSRQNNETINNDENQILTIQHGDFVLSHFFGKRKIYKYVCLVTKVSGDDDAEVTCLRKLKNSCEFRLDENDKCSILLSDIIEKLPKPKLLPHGQFQKYVFPESIKVSEL